MRVGPRRVIYILMINNTFIHAYMSRKYNSNGGCKGISNFFYKKIL